MIARTIAALLLTCTLNGCSSVYDLRAILIDGKVAFFPEDTDIWGDLDPDCFYSIEVSIVDGPSATPAAGESAGLVRNGVYWNRTFAATSCDNRFPVVYGATLQGPVFRENDKYEVEAKPLLLGFTYEVLAVSKGSAYGSRKFKLTKNGSVENLPR